MCIINSFRILLPACAIVSLIPVSLQPNQPIIFCVNQLFNSNSQNANHEDRDTVSMDFDFMNATLDPKKQPS